MASNNSTPKLPLPSSPTITSPTGLGSRRESIASVSASSQADNHQLALALDKIRTSASQSDVLTTFNDFTPAPGSLPTTETKSSAGEIVQQGLSGLYSRLKEAVGVAGKPHASQEGEDGDFQDAASKKSSSTATTGPKTSVSPLARGESGTTTSTFASPFSSDLHTSATTSSAVAAGNSQSQVLPSKSSVTTMTSAKSTAASGQSVPKIAQAPMPTAATPSVAPVTVSAFKERDVSRGASNMEESAPRSSATRSTSKAPDASPSTGGPGNTNLERGGLPERPTVLQGMSRREDTVGLDGSPDTPLTPLRGITDMPGSETHSRVSSRDLQNRPAVVNRLSQSNSRYDSRSRSSSMELGNSDPSSISTSAQTSVRHHDSLALRDGPEQVRSGGMKVSGTTTGEGAPEMVNARLELMRKQVLSKEFWMADETCKECFLCGTPFSAFRRKHHCRTCGCIFDSKCTSIISGQKFGVPGSLRVCKTCLNIINRRYESDSDDTADETYLPSIFRPNHSKGALTSPKSTADDEVSIAERHGELGEQRSLTTPMMAIPATRRLGEPNRTSAILEIDTPQLSRPSSSRSLKSLASARPQSSGHKRHQSKHSFLTRFKSSSEDRAPFRRPAGDDLGRKSRLPAFHDDNIIDPELAPYMSDESSGDEQMSILATMASNDFQSSSGDRDKPNFGSLLNVNRKHRFRQGEKSISGVSFTSRGPEEGGFPTGHMRPTRRRNMSTASASVHHIRSPRPKSGVFKGPSASTDTLSIFENYGPGEPSKLSVIESAREHKSPEVELGPASLNHVKKLFRQLLEDGGIPNPSAWEKALLPILIRCADDVEPDIRNGDDMDIRHYVKLKRIPGGKPGDTTYVSGVVFTKNLALKSMPRRIFNSPRIVLVSFPIEYQRHSQHFMSLQPVIQQEKEFLRVVVNRILALRPHVLLAEKTVAGVALQYLAEAGIAVVYNVKPSVIEAVSRIAQTEVISSIDMLALPVQVGTCGAFEVKTFVNNEIPGRKKTYIFIGECERTLGCTIALRGASSQVLARMKRITEFMVYVVYNLKLESCLMRDEFIHVPAEHGDLAPTPSTSRLTNEDSQRSDNQLSAGPTASTPAGTPHSTQSQSGDSERPTQTSDGLSTSGELRPPEARPEVKRLISLHETHAHVSSDSPGLEDLPAPTFYSDMVAKYKTKVLSASPFVRFPQPYLLNKAREQERRLVYLKRLRDQDIVEEQEDGEKAKPQRFQLIKPEMVHEIGQKAPRHIMEVLHAVHDAEYDKALYNYQVQTKQWENYIKGSLDLFDPYSHQNIVVLYSLICTETKIPCAEPGLVAIGFYDEHPDSNGPIDPDCTLGQYIEDLCETADIVCHANGCDRALFQHHRTYVHDEARITVFVEKDSPMPLGMEVPDSNEIYMWNYCKFCKKDIGIMPMSVSAWKYSFGKYLELSFWCKGLQLNPVAQCQHDHQKDHIRYFHYKSNTIRIHYDPIDLLEIIVPRTRITWKVDKDLGLKNELFVKFEDRWNRFMNSVKARLKSIRIDSVLPEKTESCQVEVERLVRKAQEDQPSLIRQLQQAYMNSKYYEIVPLNAVVREMLEKVAEWDGAFAKFESDFLSDKDVRQLTILQLKKMFTDNESKESLPTTDGSTSIGGSESEDRSTTVTTQTSISEGDERPDEKSAGSQDKKQGDKDVEMQMLKQASDESGSVPSTTPTEAAQASGAVEIPRLKAAADEAGNVLERVEPLDLATPPSPVLAKATALLRRESTGESSEAPATQQSSALPTPLATATLAEPNALPAVPQMSLSEKVAQLRREAQAQSTDLAQAIGSGDSIGTRPRAADRNASGRRTGLTISPPIVRAISQPAGVLPRTQSSLGLGKLAKDPKLLESGSGLSELQRVSTDGSAKSDKKLADRIGLTALKNRKAGPSGIPRYVHKKKETKVSTLARHFEQLSREFEKERMKDRKQRAAKMHYSRAFLPRSSTKTIVEVYNDVDQAVQEPGPSDDDHLFDREQSDKKYPDTANRSEGTAEASNSKPNPEQGPVSPTTVPNSQAERTATEGELDEQRHESQANSDDEGAASDADQSLLDDILPDVKEIADSLEPSEEIPLELPKHQKAGLMTMLTKFWAERSASGWPQLEYPVNATDHIFINSDIIVREDEPSSLIAFALSSEDYKVKLADIRRNWKKSVNKVSSQESSNGLEIASRTHTHTHTHTQSSDFILDERELEKSLLRPTGTHLKYQFTEGSAKLMCKIFFAEQFDALRQKCGVADRIVESLSRCLKWDSQGGKTKSVFLKTLDDRLVMKSLSPIETSAFLRFAPDYFNIMAKTLFHDLPSVIAKMLGFFQVIIKNPLTNTEIKLDLLVMENLFYDRSPTRIFDLKGSMRNRKIESTGKDNEVLLDQNMVEYIYESPLFAREHSKGLLRVSVWNDTLFLALQNVMDYSLMVAVDEARKELVVGIIDCIRTYTWDKRLESWIKDRGFAGGGRNRPTITSPKEYKSRFREAMARYILLSPNCWHQFRAPQAVTPVTSKMRLEGDA